MTKVEVKKILWIYLCAFLLAAFSFRADAAEKKADKADTKAAKEIFAVFETNKGKFKVKFFPETAPKTVENFVGLATGKKAWTDPKTGKEKKAPYYDGLTFHRVIPDFMIQGGCPLGNGTGGPGYTFEDEISPNSPSMDKPGILAMANAGRNTNGSQFFITVAPTTYLNPKHTVFGEVVDGMDVVYAISKVKADDTRPVEPVIIKHIKIVK